MYDALIQLGLFTAKTVIVILFILSILIAFFALLAKSKDKFKERLVIKNLNDRLKENEEIILSETLPKKLFKQFLKEKKQEQKIKEKSETKSKTIYVMDFDGDVKASAVSSLREVISSILRVATPQDEVVLRLESGGGMVHAYGLAAAQLMRIRAKNIPLTIVIDKIAASGGYMMACVANKVLAAPFSIIGSIGVIVQFPNFHRLLQDKHIDFEQHIAGKFKRTITLFGENTKEGRDKLQHEIEDVHGLFKNLIQDNRPGIDIEKVSTGEHWLGTQALELKLVDDIKTSDEYLMDLSKEANVFEISYEIKKPFFARMRASASVLYHRLFY